MDCELTIARESGPTTKMGPQDSASAAGPLRVLVLTPLGRDGAGGIDRVMDGLREQVANDAELEVRFVTTRGRRLWASPAYTALACLRVLSAGARRNVDAVHINLASRASTFRKLVLAACCRAVRIPYVVHLHGAQFHKFWASLGPARRALVDDFFRKAGATVVLGGIWRDLITEQVPEATDRVFIVPNASPARPCASGAADGRVTILFLGRLGPRKGVPDLVRALSGLDRATSWRAIIAGDGEIASTRGAIADHGLSDRVDVPGWVGPQRVAELMRGADVLALPSYDENLPMSVVEAFAAGLAVVTTPVGATPDILHHEENGLLVEPGDVNALKHALQRLISDEPLRKRLGEAARQVHAAQLDLDGYGRRLAEVWAFAARTGPKFAGRRSEAA